ncbi:MAG: hypothetical protein WDO73_08140 [Ignavibacteriota bacterium]
MTELITYSTTINTTMVVKLVKVDHADLLVHQPFYGQLQFVDGP